MGQSPRKPRNSRREKLSQKKSQSTTTKSSTSGARRKQAKEIAKRIQEGTWWPFDMVDPELLAMVKPKTSNKPEQHETSPF